jgi:hypothetical protein
MNLSTFGLADILTAVFGWPATLSILLAIAGGALWWVAENHGRHDWHWGTYRFWSRDGRVLTLVGILSIVGLVTLAAAFTA